MSAVVILTPLVISSWPVIASAIMGAAASMGFSVGSGALQEPCKPRRKRVESEIENSEVVADEMAPGQTIVIERDGVRLEFSLDERGRCTVCASGENHSDRQLKKIADEVAGRVVQQFVYHKLVTELKSRSYEVTGEEVLKDQSVRLRVRLS